MMSNLCESSVEKVSVQLGNKTGVNPPKWGLANLNNSDIISQ
jgi:hypothetical protein